MKKILFPLISLILIFLFSCNENEIIIEKNCTEPPGLPSNNIKLLLRTDTAIEKRFQINDNGYFLIENTPVKSGTYIKNVNIHGFICKEYISEVFVDFNDSLTNSRIKTTLRQTSPIYIHGEVWYCSNENNTCDYTEIGFVIIAITDRFEGAFVTPLISGIFDAYLLTGSSNEN